ncbi:MAG: lipoate--protein ligase family protein [Rubrobacter sp.]|jgi:lipoate-protein ligase A|nr:lipoate--protein ligase family protein [Rubrobacter sp.]
MSVEILPFQNLDEPEDGFGLQQAILEEVGARERGAAMLAWSSSPYVAATRLETRLPGFEKAVEDAENLGFPVMVRNSGGGAVAANEGSLSFSLTFPVEDMRRDLFERYGEGVSLVSAALRRVGVEAEGGEVEGEFCPGAYSVRSGGENGVKRAGLAQRVTKRAARIEALILVRDTDTLVPILEKFYGSLDLLFRPSSVGDLPASVPEVAEALSAEVRERYGGSEGSLSEAAFERAQEMRGEWRAHRPS